MTTQKHTQEPWATEEIDPLGKNQTFSYRIFSREREIGLIFKHYEQKTIPSQDQSEIDISNAKRIVSCVNALAGIENPEEFVAAAANLKDWCRAAYHRIDTSIDGGPKFLADFHDAITRAEAVFGGVK